MSSPAQKTRSKATIGLYIPDYVFSLALPFTTRGILAEIYQLSRRHGLCMASDAHFVARFDISRDTVSRALRQLEAAGLIHRETDRSAGNLRRLSPVRPVPAGPPALAANSGATSRKIRQTLAANSGAIKKNREVRKERRTPPTPVTASRPVSGLSTSFVVNPDAKTEGGAARSSDQPATLPATLIATQPATQPASAPSTSPSEPAGFADFYHAWPNRQKRRDAAKAFAALPPPDQQQALTRAAKWLAEHPRLLQRGACPYPATWLRGGMWDDEPEPLDRTPKPGPPTGPPTAAKTTARKNPDWK